MSDNKPLLNPQTLSGQSTEGYRYNPLTRRIELVSNLYSPQYGQQYGQQYAQPQYSQQYSQPGIWMQQSDTPPKVRSGFLKPPPAQLLSKPPTPTPTQQKAQQLSSTYHSKHPIKYSSSKPPHATQQEAQLEQQPSQMPGISSAELDRLQQIAQQNAQKIAQEKTQLEQQPSTESKHPAKLLFASESFPTLSGHEHIQSRKPSTQPTPSSTATNSEEQPSYVSIASRISKPMAAPESQISKPMDTPQASKSEKKSKTKIQILLASIVSQQFKNGTLYNQEKIKNSMEQIVIPDPRYRLFSHYNIKNLIREKPLDRGQISNVVHFAPINYSNYDNETNELVIVSDTMKFTDGGKTVTLRQTMNFNNKTNKISIRLDADKITYRYQSNYQIVREGDNLKIKLDPYTCEENKIIKKIVRRLPKPRHLENAFTAEEMKGLQNIESPLRNASIQYGINIYIFLNQRLNKLDKAEKARILNSEQQKQQQEEQKQQPEEHLTFTFDYEKIVLIEAELYLIFRESLKIKGTEKYAEKLNDDQERIQKQFFYVQKILETEESFEKYNNKLRKWRNDYYEWTNRTVELQPLESFGMYFEYKKTKGAIPKLSKTNIKILQKLAPYDKRIILEEGTEQAYYFVKSGKSDVRESRPVKVVKAVNFGVYTPYLVSYILRYNHIYYTSGQKYVTHSLQKLCLNEGNIGDFAMFIHNFKSACFETISLFYQLYNIKQEIYVKLSHTPFYNNTEWQKDKVDPQFIKTNVVILDRNNSRDSDILKVASFKPDDKPKTQPTALKLIELDEPPYNTDNDVLDFDMVFADNHTSLPKMNMNGNYTKLYDNTSRKIIMNDDDDDDYDYTDDDKDDFEYEKSEFDVPESALAPKPASVPVSARGSWAQGVNPNVIASVPEHLKQEAELLKKQKEEEEARRIMNMRIKEERRKLEKQAERMTMPIEVPVGRSDYKKVEASEQIKPRDKSKIQAEEEMTANEEDNLSGLFDRLVKYITKDKGRRKQLQLSNINVDDPTELKELLREAYEAELFKVSGTPTPEQITKQEEIIFKKIMQEKFDEHLKQEKNVNELLNKLIKYVGKTKILTRRFENLGLKDENVKELIADAYKAGMFKADGIPQKNKEETVFEYILDGELNEKIAELAKPKEFKLGKKERAPRNGGGFYEKYLKYKAKYLQLKELSEE